MANPSKKSEEMESVLQTVFGIDRRETIRRDVCVPPPLGCGGRAKDFKNDVSRREFNISGLCQKCQDAVFGEVDE